MDHCIAQFLRGNDIADSLQGAVASTEREGSFESGATIGCTWISFSFCAYPNSLRRLSYKVWSSKRFWSSTRLWPVTRIIIRKDSMILGGTLHKSWPVNVHCIALAPTSKPMIVRSPRSTVSSCALTLSTTTETRSDRVRRLSARDSGNNHQLELK